MQHGKKYLAVASKIEAKKAYSLGEASALAVETSPAKFDASVEIHINLNVNVKHADQIVRGTVIPPHGTGKVQRIAAFVEADQVRTAKDAGADLAGLEDLIDEISKGNINFDIAIAHPNVMKGLGKIAKTLGQKGLMPNPKSGTVTMDIASTISEIKRGKVEYRTDKTGIIHCIVGKVSFGADKIKENAKVILEAVLADKPVAVKGNYVNSVFMTTTMGPSVKIDFNRLAE
ncbi:MAG TPA: 50S ribosomal protein L1 [Candidatus Gracilibacteria bacterium]|nr:50S ribosomal protein L1 [Candidatus Gracilibacteria bacterium]